MRLRIARNHSIWQRVEKARYKKESQEKTVLQWPDFFLLRNPFDGARSVLNCRAMYSLAGHLCPVLWGFSTRGFHHVLATKPVRSETSKTDRGLMWRPWFCPGLVAHSFAIEIQPCRAPTSIVPIGSQARGVVYTKQRWPDELRRDSDPLGRLLWC